MAAATPEHFINSYGGVVQTHGPIDQFSQQPASLAPIYQFGRFCLDVGRAELWFGEDRRDVQPLILDLLQYLIANRGRVASKDELFLNVWGGNVSVVDTALTTAVCEARKAIDDDHVRQWAIRTVPRRGYRFIAPTAEGARV